MEATTASSLLLLLSVPTRSSSRPPPVLPRSTFGAKNQQHLVAPGLSCKKEKKSSFSSRSSSITRCSSSAAAADDGPSTTVGPSETWVLDPAGDGDWRHIGYKVPRPGAFQISSSDSVTVGRVADKADIVLPVATVSGAHARLEKRDDGSLVVTDLDSTNGTYINERRLVPGFPVPIRPGSLLIFGDIHLAMFRVSKVLQVEVPAGEAQGAERRRNEADAAVPAASAAAVQDTA